MTKSESTSLYMKLFNMSTHGHIYLQALSCANDQLPPEV